MSEKNLLESLNDLHRAVTSIKALLDAREMGLASWHDMLRDACVENLKALKALGVKEAS